MPTFEELQALGAVPVEPAKGMTYEQLVAAGAKPAETEPTPGLFDRISGGLSSIGNAAREGLNDVERHVGRALGVGEPALAASFGAEPTAETRASRRREVERGVDELATLGYGQRLADKAGRALGDVPGLQLGATQAGDAAVAPGYRDFGRAVGIVGPGAAGLIERGAGAGVNLLTRGIQASTLPGGVALGALKGAAAYELAAPVQAGLSADAAGNRLGVARDVATDPAGLALAAGTGGLAGGFEQRARTAPARMAENIRKDVSTGEQNAKASTARKVVAKAGEGGEDLAETLARDPELERLVAVKAGTSPEKVSKAVKVKMGDLGDQLDGIYSEMSKAGRVVTPTDIAVNFDKLLGEKLKAGDLDAVKAIRQSRATFLDEYGKFGHLDPETMRGLKSTAGRAGFAGDTTTPPNVRAQVQRDVWGVFSDAIERQAKGTKGIDVAKLRELNQDMSRLIPVSQALEERATLAASGRKSLAEHLSHAGGAALGGVVGGTHGGLGGALGVAGGLAVAAARPAAVRLARQGSRLSDYMLTKGLGGVAPDLAASAGARAGSLDYATKVANGMRAGLSLQDAAKAAEEE